MIILFSTTHVEMSMQFFSCLVCESQVGLLFGVLQIQFAPVCALQSVVPSQSHQFNTHLVDMGPVWFEKLYHLAWCENIIYSISSQIIPT
jgi:hypothetical protein